MAVHRFALQHLEGPAAPFEVVPESPKPKRRKVNDIPSHLDLLQACFSLLSSDQAHFSRLWHWSALINQLSAGDVNIKW